MIVSTGAINNGAIQSDLNQNIGHVYVTWFKFKRYSGFCVIYIFDN